MSYREHSENKDLEIILIFLENHSSQEGQTGTKKY